jgi:Arc/MetJ family transcription regulator
MNKTTMEIDEEKLKRVMKLGGFKTRKEAVDWALTEAERLATINRIAEEPWSAEMLKDAIDPGYDVLATRRQPVGYSAKPRNAKR